MLTIHINSFHGVIESQSNDNKENDQAALEGRYQEEDDFDINFSFDNLNQQAEAPLRRSDRTRALNKRYNNDDFETY